MGIPININSVAIPGALQGYGYIGQNRRVADIDGSFVKESYWRQATSLEGGTKAMGGPDGIASGPTAQLVEGSYNTWPHVPESENIIYGRGGGAYIVYAMSPVRFPQLDRIKDSSWISSARCNVAIGSTATLKSYSISLSYSSDPVETIWEENHKKYSQTAFGHPSAPNGFPYIVYEETTTPSAGGGLAVLVLGIKSVGGQLQYHAIGSGDASGGVEFSGTPNEKKMAGATGAAKAIAENASSDNSFLGFALTITPGGFAAAVTEGGELVNSADLVYQSLVDYNMSPALAGRGYRPDIGREMNIYCTIGSMSYTQIQCTGASVSEMIMSLGTCAIPADMRLNQFPPRMD